jgi:hypothetical protein
MNRRELLVLAGSAMAAAPPLMAQQKTMPVIGLLGGASRSARLHHLWQHFVRD